MVVDTFLGSLFSLAVGREEHCKQISLTSVGSAHSDSATLALPPLTVCVLSLHCLGSRLLCWEPCEAGPGLYALPRSSRSGSGIRVVLKGAGLDGPAFSPFPRLSPSGDQAFGECGRCDSSPPPSLLLGFPVAQLAHLLRRMSTVQNPKKSWLATKPACSLVDDASPGL